MPGLMPAMQIEWPDMGHNNSWALSGHASGGWDFMFSQPAGQVEISVDPSDANQHFHLTFFSERLIEIRGLYLHPAPPWRNGFRITMTF